MSFETTGVFFRGEWIPGDKPLLHDMPIGLQQDIALEDAQKTIANVSARTNTQTLRPSHTAQNSRKRMNHAQISSLT